MTSIFQPRFSAKREYIRKRSETKRAASSPPVPARISTMAGLSASSSRGAMRSWSSSRARPCPPPAPSPPRERGSRIAGSESSLLRALAPSRAESRGSVFGIGLVYHGEPRALRAWPRDSAPDPSQPGVGDLVVEGAKPLGYGLELVYHELPSPRNRGSVDDDLHFGIGLGFLHALAQEPMYPAICAGPAQGASAVAARIDIELH